MKSRPARLLPPGGTSRARRVHAMTRRQLLRGVVAGALAARGLASEPISATSHAPAVAVAPALAGQRTLGAARWATLRAFALVMLPAAGNLPGAEKAGAIEYLKQALAGEYAVFLGVYRRALDDLEALARRQGAVSVARSASAFASLSADRATLVTRQFAAASPRDFAVLRQHVLEGFLADPVHGGNRDRAGWETVGLVHKHKE
ncbi:MAG: gluconate 2-dehydrogenase subunit 3 family protein [Candidatus Wallbacteria bacterium]|nr:gluconate 2-dehydrogenase subunit 3 family protein [Candidatus Wallbacteria bacterium]